MTSARRFARFNVVSAAGFVVQLATVAILTHWLGVWSVVATGFAVGAAVVHNFLWHRCWTWKDRQDGSAAPGRTFLRFATSNGLVSLAGNLIIVAILADAIGLDVVLANVAAVAVCGLLNFQIGDRVVFRAARRAS